MLSVWVLISTFMWQGLLPQLGPFFGQLLEVVLYIAQKCTIIKILGRGNNAFSLFWEVREQKLSMTCQSMYKSMNWTLYAQAELLQKEFCPATFILGTRAAVVCLRRRCIFGLLAGCLFWRSRPKSRCLLRWFVWKKSNKMLVWTLRANTLGWPLSTNKVTVKL